MYEQGDGELSKEEKSKLIDMIELYESGNGYDLEAEVVRGTLEVESDTITCDVTVYDRFNQRTVTHHLCSYNRKDLERWFHQEEIEDVK